MRLRVVLEVEWDESPEGVEVAFDEIQDGLFNQHPSVWFDPDTDELVAVEEVVG